MREARSVMAELAASGLTPDQLALVMELTVSVTAEARPMVDEGAQRRREKDRERKRYVRGNPQTSAESADKRKAPKPPKETTPIPPLKGGTFPKLNADQPEKPISAWVDEIWKITGILAKPRTSRRDIERALISAMRRDHDPAEVLAGLKAYYASPDATKDGGKYAKGAHRIIENDRWQSFEVFDESPPNTPDPWASRVREFRRNGYWNSTDWGPKPGKPGCNAPSALLVELVA